MAIQAGQTSRTPGEIDSLDLFTSTSREGEEGLAKSPDERSDASFERCPKPLPLFTALLDHIRRDILESFSLLKGNLLGRGDGYR